MLILQPSIYRKISNISGTESQKRFSSSRVFVFAQSIEDRC